ncbi:MAG: glycosyl transferase, family 2 [Bryobacterales bacterium]|nr:glycosyl transferase, family 2 [Bryobacterales bacterium]
MSSKTLRWVVLALLAAAGVYGFLHERLWAQSMWSEAGRARFIGYAVVFWSVAGLILWLCPRWLGVIAPAAALLYAAWWSGPMAPIAVLYFMGSSFCLGKRMVRDADPPTATLLGAAVWMFLIWIALHFPVNTRGVYAVALAIPYVLGYRALYVRNRATIVMERSEACALAVLLFVLGAHFLAALKPEISADGLSMHLALPMAVARDTRWAFDFHLNSWALMPAGADSLYTAAYLLGGEDAAHLLNFAFLVLMCILLAHAARRWVSPAQSWLIAALFASTPLVQLVTGSLFVENVWAAMILAATLALARYLEKGQQRDLILTGAFVGAAMAVKLIAGAFAAPIVIIAMAAALGKRQWKAAVTATVLLALFAAPPYVYAFAKTGNPVFPFANKVFRSPDFDTAKSFSDPRFTAALSWKTPYGITFRSAKFLEAQGGAGGFQYFLLLVPAILWARRRVQWTIVAITGVGAGIILAIVPYLRYLYPALPLASLAIAWIVAEAPSMVSSAALHFLIALNLWFLPSSGSYNKDFALLRHSEIRPYVERMAPVRLLIADLNRRAPGEPVAFFSTEQTGDLNGPAYTDSWHSERYWNRLQNAQTPRAVATILNDLGIHYVVAPDWRQVGPLPVQLFVRLWLDPLREPVGPLGLFRMRDLTTPPDTSPFSTGRYDDLDERVEYSGAWRPDLQFRQSSDQSITYSDTPGNWFRISFTGRAITYVFTQAANRGIAKVIIDGRPQARINQYSAQTQWQSMRRFGGLALGTHTLEVRVSGEKDPLSGGLFVDLDAFVVEP